MLGNSKSTLLENCPLHQGFSRNVKMPNFGTSDAWKVGFRNVEEPEIAANPPQTSRIVCWYAAETSRMVYETSEIPRFPKIYHEIKDLYPLNKTVAIYIPETNRTNEAHEFNFEVDFEVLRVIFRLILPF